MDIKKAEWEESYQRKENFIFYPHDECVKFLNRFVRKKISSGADFINLLESDKELTALDFGCGVGRSAILMSEFNINAYGVDISETAIEEAKRHAKKYNCENKVQFQAYDGANIPFEDGFFDFTLSYAVLDSLPFELAKKLLKEIDRVTKKYFFISLISAESNSLFGAEAEITEEIIVEESHEKGTVQCCYNLEKINRLIQDTQFKIKWGELITHQDILNSNKKHGRYNIVLEK